MWGPGFDTKGTGVGGGVRGRGKGGGTGGTAQFVRGNYISFKGINLTVLEKNNVYIYIDKTPL